MKDSEFVIMPRRLTAENGAKYLLLGEFFIEHEVFDDEGSHIERVVVDWHTIKQIYAMAVDNLAEKELPKELSEELE